VVAQGTANFRTTNEMEEERWASQDEERPNREPKVTRAAKSPAKAKAQGEEMTANWVASTRPAEKCLAEIEAAE